MMHSSLGSRVLTGRKSLLKSKSAVTVPSELKTFKLQQLTATEFDLALTADLAGKLIVKKVNLTLKPGETVSVPGYPAAKIYLSHTNEITLQGNWPETAKYNLNVKKLLIDGKKLAKKN